MYLEFITTADTIEVRFNDLQYSESIAMVKASFSRCKILCVWYSANGYVSVKFTDNNEWYFNLNGSEGHLPVSLIDGVAPTSLDDIYNYFNNTIK